MSRLLSDDIGKHRKGWAKRKQSVYVTACLQFFLKRNNLPSLWLLHPNLHEVLQDLLILRRPSPSLKLLRWMAWREDWVESSENLLDSTKKSRLGLQIQLVWRWPSIVSSCCCGDFVFSRTCWSLESCWATNSRREMPWRKLAKVVE